MLNRIGVLITTTVFLVSNNLALAAQANELGGRGSDFRQFRDANPDLNGREARQAFREQMPNIQPIVERHNNVQTPHLAPIAIPSTTPHIPREDRQAARVERHSTREQTRNLTTQVSDAGKTLNMNGARVNLDLTSTTQNITLGANLFKNNNSVTIKVGGQEKTVGAGSKVTAAEYVAVKQALQGSNQTVNISDDGRATSGQVDLSAMTAGNKTMKVNDLTVPVDVTASGDFGKGGDVKITGDLNNSGSINAFSSGHKNVNALIKADNITNNAGASINSTVSDLTLQADTNFSNFGDINATGNLTVAGGKSLTNTGTITADQNLNVLSPDVTNSGVIASTSQNVTLDSPVASTLNVANGGGSIEALKGSINVRAPNYDGTFNTKVTGGNLLSKEVNVSAGQATADLDVEELTGVVNTKGLASHVNADTETLTIGQQCLTGDPTYYNTGNIQITGDIVVGEALAIIAQGNITATSGLTQIATNGSASTGHSIYIIAGANPTGGTVTTGTTLPAQTFPTYSGNATTNVTITGNSATGGNVDLSGANANLSITSRSTNSDTAGGDITIAAYAGTGGGRVTLPVNSTIDSRGNGAGANGNVTILAGATSGTLQVGNIVASGPGGGTGGGAVSIATAQPTFSGAATSMVFDPTGAVVGSTVLQASATNTGRPITLGNITGSSVTARGGSITANGAITSTVGNISLTGSTGNVAFGTTGSVSSADDVTVSGASITGTSATNIIQGDVVSLTASLGTGKIGAAATRLYTSANALVISAGDDAYINEANDVSVSGSVANVGGQFFLDTLGTGDLTITGVSGNEIRFNTFVEAGNVNNIFLNGAVNGSGGTAALNANGSIIGSSLVSGNIVNLTAQKGNIGTGTLAANRVNTNAATTLTINAGQGSAWVNNDVGVSLGASSASNAGTLALETDAGSITISGLLSGGTVTLDADTSILSNTTSSIAATTLNLIADTGSIGNGIPTANRIRTNVTNLNLDAGSNAYIAETNALALNQALVPGDLYVTAGGQLDVNGAVNSNLVNLVTTAGGNINVGSTMQSTTSLTLNAGGSITNPGANVWNANSTSLTAGANIGLDASDAGVIPVNTQSLALSASAGSAWISNQGGALTLTSAATNLTSGQLQLFSQAAGNITIAGAVTGNNIQIGTTTATTDDIIVNGTITASGAGSTVALTAGGDIPVNAAIGGSVIGLTATAGTITPGANIGTSTSAVTLSANNIAETAAGTIAGTTVSLTATGGSIGTGNSNRVSTSAGALTLSAANGSAYINEANVVTLNASTVLNDLFLTLGAAGNLTLGGNLEGSDIRLVTFGGATSGIALGTFNVAGGTNVSLSANNSITGSGLVSANNVSLSSTVGSIGVAGTGLINTDANNLTISANASGQDAFVANVGGTNLTASVNDDLVVTDNGAIVISSVSTGTAVGNTISLTAGGSITSDTPTSSISGYQITLVSNNGNIGGGDGARLQADSTILSATANSSTTGNGNVWITDAGNVQINASSANKDFHLNSTGVGSILVNGAIGNATDIVLATSNVSGNNITLNGTVGTAGTTTNVSLTAPGSITGTSTVSGTTVSLSGATIGTATSSRVSTNADLLNITATAGDVFINEANGVTLNSLSFVGATNFYLSSLAAGDLTVNAASPTAPNSVDLRTAGASDIILNNSITTTTTQTLVAGQTIRGAGTLSGTALTLTATAGNIGTGTGTGAVKTNATSLALTATNSGPGVGNVWVEEQAGGVSLQASAANKAFELTSVGTGNVTVDGAVTGNAIVIAANNAPGNQIVLNSGITASGTGSINLSASSNISGAGLLTAATGSVTLTSTGGSIGSGSNRVNTTTASLDVHAANGSAFITETNGVILNASNVNTATGQLFVDATGTFSVAGVTTGNDIRLSTAGATSDIQLNNTITAGTNLLLSAGRNITGGSGVSSTGQATFLATNGITATGLIAAPTVLLRATNGAIGSTSANVNTAATNLTANAGTNSYVHNNQATNLIDQTVNAVSVTNAANSGTGIWYLKSDGSVTQSLTSTPVSAFQVGLETTAGNIGSNSTFFAVNASRLTAKANATNGSSYVRNTAGNTALANVTVEGGAIANSASNAGVWYLNAPLGDVTNAAGATAVAAGQVAFEAANVGTASTALAINATSLTSNVTGSSYITDSTGDISFSNLALSDAGARTLVNSGSNFYLRALGGSILQSVGSTPVAATRLGLQALTDIGTATGPLSVNTTYLAARAGGSSFVSDSGNTILADFAFATPVTNGSSTADAFVWYLNSGGAVTSDTAYTAISSDHIVIQASSIGSSSARLAIAPSSQLTTNTTGSTYLSSSTASTILTDYAGVPTVQNGVGAGSTYDLLAAVGIVINGNVNGGSVLNLTTQNGAITQTNTAAVLTANTIALNTTNGGIGSSAARIQTNADNLSVSTTGSGAIFINEMSGVTLNPITTAGNVSINANGIMNANAINATGIVLSATSDINLAGNLTAPNGMLLVSGRNITTTNANMSINANDAAGAAGRITMVSGANYTVNAGDITTTSASSTGGNITLSNTLGATPLSATSSVDAGGNIGFVAYANGGGGVVNIAPTITATTGGAAGFNNGSFNVIAGATGGTSISVGNVNTTGGNTGTGVIALRANAPSLTPITFSTSTIGNYNNSAAIGTAQPASIAAGNLTTDGVTMTIVSGNNLALGNLSVDRLGATNTNNGATVNLTWNSGSALAVGATTGVNHVGTISARGGQALGNGGTISLTNLAASGGGITIGDLASLNATPQSEGNGGRYFLNAGNGSLTITGTLDANAKSGSVLDYSGGLISLTGTSVNVVGNATLSADSSGTGNGGGVAVLATGATSNITIGTGTNQLQISTQASPAATTGSFVNLEAGGQVIVASTGTLDATNGVELTAGNGIQVNGTVSGVNYVDAETALGNITGTGTLTSTNVSLLAQVGSIGTGPASRLTIAAPTVGGSHNLRATAGQNVYIRSTADTLNLGIANLDLNSAGLTFDVEAAGDVTSASGQDVTANNVVIRSQNAGIAIGGNVTGTTTVTLRAFDSVTNGSAASLITNQLILVSDNGSIGVDLLNPFNTAVGTLTAQAENGSVYLNNTSTGNVDIVNAGGFSNTALNTWSLTATNATSPVTRIRTAAGVNITADTIALTSTLGGLQIAGGLFGTSEVNLTSNRSIVSSNLTGTIFGDLVALNVTGAGQNIGTNASSRLNIDASNRLAATSVSGGVYIFDPNFVTLDGGSAATDINVFAAIDMGTTIAPISGNAVTLRAGSGVLTIAAPVTATTSIALQSGSDLEIASTGSINAGSATTSATATAGGNLNINGTVSTSSFNGTANFDVNVNNSVTTNNLTLRAVAGSLTVNNASVIGLNTANLRSGGNMTTVGTGGIVSNAMILTSDLGSIGSSAASRLNVAANNLSANAATNVFVADANPVTITGGSAGSTFSVVSFGNITTSGVISSATVGLGAIAPGAILDLNAAINATTAIGLVADGNIVNGDFTVLNAPTIAFASLNGSIGSNASPLALNSTTTPSLTTAAFDANSGSVNVAANVPSLTLANVTFPSIGGLTAINRAAGEFNVTNGGALTANGSVTGNGVSLVSLNNTLSVNGTVNSGSVVNFNGNTVNVGGSVTGLSITIIADTGDLNVLGSAALTATAGNITLTGQHDANVFNGATLAAGANNGPNSISVTATTGGLTASGSFTAGTVSLTAFESLNNADVSGGSFNTSQLNLTSTNGGIGSSANPFAVTSGLATFNLTANAATDAYVAFTGTSLNLGTGNSAAGGTLRVVASGALTTGGTVTANNLILTAGTTLAMSSVVTGTTTLQLTANGNVTTSGAGSVQGGAASISSINGNIGNGFSSPLLTNLVSVNASAANGNVAIAEANAINITGGTANSATGNFIVSANGNLSSTGVINANTVLLGAGALIEGSGSRISLGAAVNATSLIGLFADGDILNGDFTVLNAPTIGMMSVSGNIGTAADALVLNSTNAPTLVNGSFDADHGDMNVAADIANLNLVDIVYAALGGIDTTTQAGNVLQVTNTGNIVANGRLDGNAGINIISSAGDVTVNNLSFASGAVNFEGNNVMVAGDIYGPLINFTANTGDVTVANTGLVISYGDLNITAEANVDIQNGSSLTAQSGNDITVVATTGGINANGSFTAGTISLTAFDSILNTNVTGGVFNAANLNITSTDGSIGASGSPFTLNGTNSVAALNLTANAADDAFVDFSGTSLNLGTSGAGGTFDVSSSGSMTTTGAVSAAVLGLSAGTTLAVNTTVNGTTSVDLTAGGNITTGVTGLVQGGTATITSTGGNIGNGFASALKTNAVSVNASAANGSVAIVDTDDLDITGGDADGNFIVLANGNLTSSGAITADTVLLGAGALVEGSGKTINLGAAVTATTLIGLFADGSILNGDFTVLDAPTVAIVSISGSIGTAADALVLNSTNAPSMVNGSFDADHGDVNVAADLASLTLVDVVFTALGGLDSTTQAGNVLSVTNTGNIIADGRLDGNAGINLTSTAGDVTVNNLSFASGTVNFEGNNVTVAGDIYGPVINFIANTGDVSVTGTGLVISYGDLNITAQNDVSIASGASLTAQSGNDITVVATTGGITAAGSFAAGTVSLTSFDSILNGNVTGAVFNAEQLNLTSTNGSIGTSVNAFALNAANSVASLSLTVNAATDAYIAFTGTNLNLGAGSSTVGGTFGVTSSASINTTGAVTADVLDMNAGTTLAIGSVVEGTTSVALTAAGNITTTATGLVQGGAASLTSTGGNIGNGFASPLATNVSSVSASAVAGNVAILDQDGIDIAGGTANGDFIVSANGNLSSSGVITADTVLLGAGALVEGSGFTLNLGAAVNANSLIGLFADGDILNGDFTVLNAPTVAMMSISGNIGTAADALVLNGTNAPSLVNASFDADHGDMNVDADFANLNLVDVVFTALGGIDATNQAGNIYNVNNTGNIVANGRLDGNAGINLTSSNGDVTVNNLSFASGAVNFVGNNVTVSGDIYGPVINFTANTGDVSVTNTALVISYGDLNISAANDVSIASGASLTAQSGNDITVLATGGGISASGSFEAGTVSLTSFDSLLNANVNGAVFNAAQLNLTSTNGSIGGNGNPFALSLANSVTSLNLTANAADDVYVAFTGTALTLGAGSSSAGGVFDVSAAAGSLTTTGSVTATDVSLTAGTSLAINSVVEGSTSVALDAGLNITTGSGGLVQGGAATISSTAGSIGNGFASALATNVASVNASAANGNVAIIDQDGLDITGGTANGDFIVLANGNLTSSGAITGDTVLLGAGALVEGSGFTISLGDAVTATTLIGLFADGDILNGDFTVLDAPTIAMISISGNIGTAADALVLNGTNAPSMVNGSFDADHGDMNVAADLASLSLVDVVFSALGGVDSTTQAGNVLNVTNTGNIVADGRLDGNAGINLTSTAGDVTVNNLAFASGAVNFEGNNVTVAGDIFGPVINFVGNTGDVTVTGTATVISYGDLNITAANDVNVQTGSSLTAQSGNDITVIATGGGINASGSFEAGTVSLTSFDSILNANVTGAVFNAGQLNLTSTNGSIGANGNAFALSASNSVASLNLTANAASDAYVAFTGAALTLGAGNSSAGGAFNVTSTGSLTTDGDVAADDVTLGAGSTLAINSLVDGSNTVTLIAGGNITTGVGGLVQGGAATISSTAGNIGNGFASALATNVASVNASAANGNVAIIDQDGLDITGGTAGGDFVVLANGNLTSTGAITGYTVLLGAGALVEGSGFTISLGDAVTATTLIGLFADGDILNGDFTVLNAPTVAMMSVSGNIGTAANALVLNSINAPSLVNASFDADHGDMNVAADLASLTLVDVVFSALGGVDSTTQAGNVLNVTNTGNIVANGRLDGNAGINLTSSAGDVTVNNLSFASGAVNFIGNNVTVAGDIYGPVINFTANTGDVTVTNTALVISYGDLNITAADDVSIASGASLTAQSGNDITVVATAGGITAGGSFEAGTVSWTSFDSILNASVTGAVFNAGQLNLTSTNGSIGTSASAFALNAVNSVASLNLTANAADDVYVAFTGTSLNLGAGNSSAGGTFDVSSTGSLTTTGGVSADDVSLLAGTTLAINSLVNGTTTVAINADGNITTGVGGLVQGGAATINSVNGSVGTGDANRLATNLVDLSVSANGNVLVGDGGALNITSGSAGGTFDVAAFTALSTSGSVSGNAVALTAGTTLAVNALLNGTSTVALNAGGNITTGASGLVQGGAATIATIGGNIGNGFASALATNLASVNASASGNVAIIDNNGLDITGGSASGDFIVLANGNLTSSGVISGGTVLLGAGALVEGSGFRIDLNSAVNATTLIGLFADGSILNGDFTVLNAPTVAMMSVSGNIGTAANALVLNSINAPSLVNASFDADHGDMNVAADLASLTLVDVVFSALGGVDSTTQAGNVLNVTNTGNIVANGRLDGNAGINLTSSAGDVTVNNLSFASGAVNFIGNNVTVAGDIYGPVINFTANTGDVTVSNTALVISYGDLNITADDDVNVATGASLTAQSGNDITVVATTGGINANGSFNAGTISLTGASIDDTAGTGTLTATTVNLTATGTIGFTNAIETVAANLSISAGDDAFVNNTGSVNLLASNATVFDLSTTAGNITVQGAVLADDINLTANGNGGSIAGDIIINSSLTASNSVSLDADGAISGGANVITADAVSLFTVGGDITVTVSNGANAIALSTNSGAFDSNITYVGTGALTLNASSGAELNLTATQSAASFITGADSTFTGDINITANALTNGFDIASTGGNINIQSLAGSGLVLTGGSGATYGSYSADGDITVTASAGNLDLNGLTRYLTTATLVADGAGQAVNVNAGSDSIATVQSFIVANMLNFNGGTLTTYGVPGATWNLVSTGTGTYANSNGDITLTGDLNFANLSLAIIASGNINLSGFDIDLSGASAGSLTMLAGYTFQPATAGFVIDTTNTFNNFAPSTGGGSILNGGNIITSSTGANGGTVLAVANGSISFANIDTSSSNAGSNGGNVTLIGNDGVTVGNITTTGGTGGASGAVTLAVADANVPTGTNFQILNGAIVAGSQPVTVGTATAGNLTVGSINAAGATVALTGAFTGGVTPDSITTTGTLTAATLSLNTGAGVANIGNSAIGTLNSAATGAADVNITNNSTGLVLGTITGANQDLSVVANGAITNTSGFTVDGLALTGSAAAGAAAINLTGTVNATTEATLTSLGGGDIRGGLNNTALLTLNSSGDIGVPGTTPTRFVTNASVVNVSAADDAFLSLTRADGVSLSGGTIGGDLNIISAGNLTSTGAVSSDTAVLNVTGNIGTDLATRFLVNTDTLTVVATGNAFVQNTLATAVTLVGTNSAGTTFAVGSNGDLTNGGTISATNVDLRSGGVLNGLGTISANNLALTQAATITNSILTGATLTGVAALAVRSTSGNVGSGTAALTDRFDFGTIANGSAFSDTGSVFITSSLATFNLVDGSAGGTGTATTATFDYLGNTTQTNVVGNITTTNGNISIKTLANKLTIADSAHVHANGTTAGNGNLIVQVLDNSKTAKKNTLLTIEGTLETDAIGTDGVITIAVGDLLAPVKGKQPKKGVDVDETAPGEVFWGKRASRYNGVTNFIAKGTNIVISNNLRKNDLVFDNAVVDADPPVASGTTVLLASANAETPSTQQSSIAKSVSTESMSSTVANVETALVPMNASIEQTILGAATAVNSNSLTAGAEKAATASAVEDDSFAVGYGLVSGEADSSICSDLELGLNSKGISSVSHAERVVIKKGNVLFAPFRDTVVATPNGEVRIAAKSVVLVASTSSELSVYDLSDARKGSVAVSANGHNITLAPGHHVTVSSRTKAEFAQINAIETVSHRNVASVVKNGFKAHTSEFSVVSAIDSVKAIKALVGSSNPQAKKVADNVVKTTAVLLQLGASGGEFQHYFKPALSAMAR